ncbi:chemerin-like receptor 1 [Myxocyprinus asiaticus]|uniref:chemerin-like receptor 1 n=1 Tax=Myxocyprinus asiaticus TaxID=70543 RepID=UPI002223AAF4|nr:chemerin-like receptor 1 [Myxocyprinus asiaticus]
MANEPVLEASPVPELALPASPVPEPVFMPVSALLELGGDHSSTLRASHISTFRVSHSCAHGCLEAEDPGAAHDHNILNVIIFLLGITGNGAVIWIAGFKMKSVNTTWYLSLALSDFTFCSIIPFVIVTTVINNWIFGLFMCKFTSFAMFLIMYSSIFIVMSVDRCVTGKFPVWAQNQRTVTKASAGVVLVCFMSALLSIPAFRFRDIHNLTSKLIICFTNYEHHHTTVLLIRFILGFFYSIPNICICYSILICKLGANQMSKSTKPYKIMTLLITTFFLCWLPYHIVSIIELDESKHKFNLYIAQIVTATLAISFLNPFIYAFMPKYSTKKCC